MTGNRSSAFESEIAAHNFLSAKVRLWLLTGTTNHPHLFL